MSKKQTWRWRMMVKRSRALRVQRLVNRSLIRRSWFADITDTWPHAR